MLLIRERTLARTYPGTLFAAVALCVASGCTETPVGSTETLGGYELVVSEPSGTFTTESGDQVTLTVALSARPNANVAVRVCSSDESEGDVSPHTLTFTKDNWAAPQTITVTGEDDSREDGQQTYRVHFGPTTSSDSRFRGLTADSSPIINWDDEGAGIIVSAPSGGTSESGGTATFTVRLSTRPYHNVVVQTASNDLTEGTSAPAALTFTYSNWNAPQAITVTGVDDFVADGPQTYGIRFVSVTSSDWRYARMPLPPPVPIVNADNDSAGVSVQHVWNTFTTESGGVATAEVVLRSQPRANVTITYATSKPGEALASGTSITFTPTNWAAPQAIILTGQNDQLADGNQTFDLVFGVPVSSDTGYSSLPAPASVTFTNKDDDSPGVTVLAPAGQSTTEIGGTAVFMIILQSKPKADVTVSFASNRPAEARVAPSSLTFTPTNWASPQLVIITGQNDAVADGNQMFSIVFNAPSSTDPGYASLPPSPNVSFTNIDDDSAGVRVVSGPDVSTSESGDTATFTVVLNSEPRANVSLSYVTNDATEGTATPASLTFTPANWASPQTVTVTGANDFLVDGNMPFDVVFASPTSSDPGYASLPAPARVSFINVDDDSAGITIAAAPSLSTSEAGGVATFTVVLNAEPSANVTLTYVSSDEEEGIASPASLTFTPVNWASPQMIAVTGQDDFRVDGNATYSIIFDAPTTSDVHYAALAAPLPVSLSNTDDDTAGVSIVAAPGLATTEAGGTATFTVALTAEPAGDVLLAFASSDVTEGVASSGSLTFNTLNWASPQTVTVVGQNDDVADGNAPYSIVFAAPVSDAPGYEHLAAPASVSLTNTDDDSAGVTVAAAPNLTTTEAGGTATFTIVLNSEPTANVTIAYASSNSAEGVASPSSVTFTPASWSTPKTVTVTGRNDFLIDGSAPYDILFNAPTSADAGYAALPAPAGVSLINTDDDTAGVTIVPPLSTRTTEIGGTVTFGIVLNAQPTSDVTVSFASSNTAEGNVSPSSVTFNSATWSTTRFVTVTGRDDAVADGNAAYAIVFDVPASTDPYYAALAAPLNVSLTNVDNEVTAPSVTGRVNTRLALSSQTTVSFGGYLNGESFQQDGILTYNGYQYTAYWNTAPRVVLARRPVGNNAWSKIEMAPSYTGTSNDAHNTISLGVSPSDGRLHIAFDHHSSDLHYVRSVAGLLTNPATAVWGTTSFSAVSSSLGTEFVNLVTYPRFVTAPSGKMLFSYRYGTSGSGDEVLWEYDGTTTTWTKIGTYINGINDSVNAYLHSLEYNGTRLHAAWCWRATPDASTNQDLLYAYSDDHGRTWRNNAGTLVGAAASSPMSIASDIRVWAIGNNRGLINQEHMTVDNAGRVHVLLSHMPDAEADDSNFTTARNKSQFFHYWRDTTGVWTRVPMNIAVSGTWRGKFAVSSTNNLYAVLPNLRIASASASTLWTNWTTVDTVTGFYSDPLIDRSQLRTSNTLTVFAPTVNTSGTVFIDTLNYTIF